MSLAGTTSTTSELNALRLSQVITYPGVRPPLDWASLYLWLEKDRPVSETWSAYSGALVLFAGISLSYLIWAWRSLSPDACGILVFGAVAAGIGVLTFVPGGFGDVLVYLLQQIRALNRGVVLLQFVAVLICALGLSQLASGGAQNRRGKFACLAICVLSLPVFIYDQSRSPDKALMVSAEASMAADRAFFASVEKQMPGQHDIFQLPYQAFPEFWGPNGMRTNDSLRPFILLPHARTSAASFPGTAGFFHSLSMQDLFRSGRFGDLMSRLTSFGFEGLTFDRTGLYPYEARRLDQLLSIAKGTLHGGDNDRFVFVPTSDVSSDAPDVMANGEMLASYGPISFGVVDALPLYPKAGGAEAVLPTDATVVINRYSDQPMRTVIQFRIKCQAPTTLRMGWANQAIDATLSTAPMVFNIPVQLSERQELVKLAFGSHTDSCLADSPAVTFFE